jgi:hypothetical protein
MAEPPGSVPLAQAVDPGGEIVPAEEAEPGALLVLAADLDPLGELAGPPRVVPRVHASVGHTTRLRRGDLLVVSTRSAEPRVWLADHPGYCMTSTAVLRPSGLLDARYLLWWLRARYATRGARRPLDLRRERIELPARAGEVPRAVLALETLSTLIRLRRETLALVGRLGLALFEQRGSDPLGENGPTVALGAAIAKLERGWSPRCADRPAREGEWGVIKVSAVSSGRFDAAENKALPPGTPPREQLGLRAGDLLMVRSNDASRVGVTAVVREDHPRLLLTDKVWRVHLREGLDPLFLDALLSHPAVRERLSRMATGTIASMQNLTKERVLALRVALPAASARAGYVAERVLLDAAERSQLAQAVQLQRLLRLTLETAFASGGADGLGEVAVERALFAELSPLHRAIWRTLAAADGALTMAELSRRLAAGAAMTPPLDRLRRSLDLLTAAGAATRSEDSRSQRWEEAVPHDLAGSA